MSTLSGIASKGEKGKSKFQSLDINSLYRGESLEPHQQKSSTPRKYGMQSLGRVPSARRAPANLPSLKSEHSGNDPAISLVPSGGTGWGSKPGETGQAATPSQPTTSSVPTATSVAAPQTSAAPPSAPSAVSRTPAAATTPATSQGPALPMQQAHSDKSWSSIMAGPGEGGAHPPSFLAHQSPQFQHEFPKLSSGDGQAPATGQKGGSDTQYGPGPSLRPQTEGSWIQGGGRNTAQAPGQLPSGSGSGTTGSQPGAAAVPGPLHHHPPGGDPVGGRSSLVPFAPQGVGMGQGGPGTPAQSTGGTSGLSGVGVNPPPLSGPPLAHMPPGAGPPQFRALVPPFMYRGNFTGGFPPNFQGPIHGPPRPHFPYPENRFMPPSRPAASTATAVDEEIAPRPIIKEEDLNKMDDIAHDAGWATHDDIDYNQKLAFSDDESTQEEETRKDARGQTHSAGNKDEKRCAERDSESSEKERDDRREDRREKRPEPLPSRGPPDQRAWQQGRTMSVDFRTPPAHTGPSHGHGSMNFPLPPMRAPPHQGHASGLRQAEEEEIWRERRRQQTEEVAIAVERAKQRKEEEEKRYMESKQAAHRKLEKLEEKIKVKNADNKEHAEEITAIPIPDWEKERELRDKERDSREKDRSRTSSESRDEKSTREPRDAGAEFRQLTQMGDRAPFMRNEREGPRNERDRERDLRSERERERDMRSERERDRDRDQRERHDQHSMFRQFQNNLPPRFQKKLAEQQFMRVGSGGSSSSPQPITGSGSSPQGPPSSQVSPASQGPSAQIFDPRWTAPSTHFSGSLSTGSSSVSTKSGPPRRHADSETSGSDRERDRERDHDRDRERERERDRDEERPPSRDQREPRDRRDRHTPEIRDNRDRYRHGGRDRDHRAYTENSSNGRKPSGSYYDGPPEYGRNYGRMDYDRSSDYERNRDRDGESDSRDSRDSRLSESQERDVRHTRDIWERDRDRDVRHYDDRRDVGDTKKDAFEKHDPFEECESSRDLVRQENSEYWKQSLAPSQQEDREKPDRRDREWDRERERDGRDRDVDRRERDERPQRPDSRDSRASRDSRTSRDSAREDKSFHDNEHKLGLSSRDFPGSWSESPLESHYGDFKEEKKKDYFREERREVGRHQVPGPITREKLEAAELRGDSKRSLTQLKRSTSGGLTIGLDKKLDNKKNENQVDKVDRKPTDTLDAWGRNTQQKTIDRTTPAHAEATSPTVGRSAEATSKSWADQLPPHCEAAESTSKPSASVSEENPKPTSSEVKKESDKKDLQDIKGGSTEKLKVESKEVENEPERIEEAKKGDDAGCEVESKREKDGRRGGRGRNEQGRGNRQNWGSGYAVYLRSWGPQRDTRGRRGGHRVAHGGHGGRPPSSRSGGEWGQGSESELSGDEVSASTESGKEDAGRAAGCSTSSRRNERDRDGRRPPRSPKQSGKKLEKEERNRDMRRGEGEKNFAGSESRRYEKRSGYESTRGGREGFAPRGEPSRRGRGGFRTRGSVGRRMDCYGPPSSKSPFGQPSEDTKPIGLDEKDKENRKNADPHGGESNKEDIGGELVNSEDKMKLKQQALSAGIFGSGARHHSSANKVTSNQIPPRMQRKSESERRDSSRSKGVRGSSGGRGGNHAPGREQSSRHPPKSGGGSVIKQNSSDVGDECWETTSENSELDDRERKHEVRNGRKTFPRQRDGPGNIRRSSGLGLSNNGSRTGRPSGGMGSAQNSTGGASRAPGAEKRAGNNSGYSANSGGQRATSSPAVGMAQQPNGRAPGPRPNGSQSPAVTGNKVPLKETTMAVNRVDEIKLNDSSLVSQALSDLNASKKNARMEKEKINALEGIDLNNYASVVIVDDQPGVTMEEEHFTFDADNGFQEVRSKKNVKESRQKGAAEEQKAVRAPREQKERERERERKGKSSGNTPPAPTAGTPPASTTGTPANAMGPGPAPAVKPSFERSRQNKLPPRFAKQRENNRLQKAAQQQHVGVHNDVSEMNKINQSVSLFPLSKDSNTPAPAPSVNAWEKPITPALRPNSPVSMGSPGMQLGPTLTSSSDSCGIDVNEQPQSGGSSQRSTPNGDKAPCKIGREVTEKAVLDGTSPPFQTIIIENTNYKSTPELAMKAKFSTQIKTQRIDKSRDRKIGEDAEDVSMGFTNKNPNAMPDLSKAPDNKNDPIQMPPLTFSKNEDSVDLKLEFPFDPDLSQLTEDKTNKSMGLPRSMHMTTGVQSTISPSAADLNFKIASVKKVWESMPVITTVIEHNEDGSVTRTTSSFTPTFGNPVDAGLDPGFAKSVDGPEVVPGEEGSPLNPGGEVVYSPGPPMQGNPNNYSGSAAVSAVPSMAKSDPTSTSSNVCKLIAPQVKPQQQAVMSTGPSPIGHPGPLSPPPFNSSNAQPGHINYQPTLGGTAAQFNSISAIPSPPTVLYNSSQQVHTQGGLYGAFQIDGTQVLGGQARSQFSQFPPYGLSQGLGQTSAFNQQSMYLQTAPHPPPNAAPDMYPSNISQFRIQGPQGPFGQSQQLSNNPSTVLISSTSNSLMSASVKPSTQQIGAIGTKGGSPYQQSALPSAPQPSQLYIPFDPSQVMNVSQNYLSSSQMVQRPGPVQSNVVPTITPSSSFYSGSAANTCQNPVVVSDVLRGLIPGGQTGFYPATNSTLQAVQQPAPSAQQLHQSGSPYNLQAYGSQSGTATPVGLQNFGSQMAQQYRNAGLPGPTFLKSGGQHPSDHNAASNGRAQLKSPSNNQQDVLASVFSSTAPQIPSPKSRNSKQQQQQQQQQQSPTQQQQHHKFNPYQGGVSQSSQLAFQQNVRGQMNLGARGGMPSASRYPAPIQRPAPYQGGSAPGNNMMGNSGRHRPQHNSSHPPPSRPSPNMNKMQTGPAGGQPYYGPHGTNMKLESSSEVKTDSSPHVSSENKMPESNSANSTNNTNGGLTSNTKPAVNSSTQQTEMKMTTDANKEEISTPTTE